MPTICQELPKSIGLRDCSRKPIEQRAIPAIRHIEPLGDDTQDDRVRDQVSGLHQGLCAAAQFRALCNGIAQHVPGGYVRDLKVRSQALGLSALPCARRSKQNGEHGMSQWRRLAAHIVRERRAYLMNPS
jgi:hypothetical protein